MPAIWFTMKLEYIVYWKHWPWDPRWANVKFDDCQTKSWKHCRHLSIQSPWSSWLNFATASTELCLLAEEEHLFGRIQITLPSSLTLHWKSPWFGGRSLCHVVVVPLPLAGQTGINLSSIIWWQNLNMAEIDLDSVEVTKCIVNIHPVVGLGLSQDRHPSRGFLWNADYFVRKGYLEQWPASDFTRSEISNCWPLNLQLQSAQYAAESQNLETAELNPKALLAAKS